MTTDGMTNSSGPLSERPEILVARVFIPDHMPFSGASCCAVAAFAWVLYDYAITLRDEVVVVWRQRIRYAAFLFFWVRYIGLILLGTLVVMYRISEAVPDQDIGPGVNLTEAQYRWVMDNSAADDLYAYTPLSQFAVFWAVEIILQCRIHALYSSRGLAIFNAVLFLAELAVMLVLWNHNPFLYCIGNDGAIASSKFCGYIVPIYWIPAIGFELWLAALAFRKLKFSWGGHLFTVLVQDSIKYFALIAIVMVVHFVSALYHFDTYVLPFLVAGQTIGGSRLVLQLRKAYYEGQGARHGTTSAAHGVQRGISSLVDESFYPPPPHLSGHNPPVSTPRPVRTYSRSSDRNASRT